MVERPSRGLFSCAEKSPSKRQKPKPRRDHVQPHLLIAAVGSNPSPKLVFIPLTMTELSNEFSVWIAGHTIHKGTGPSRRIF